MIKLADGRGILYQWDTGRQVECDAEQVHFSNHHYGTSIDVDVQNGKATIPNRCMRIFRISRALRFTTVFCPTEKLCR